MSWVELSRGGENPLSLHFTLRRTQTVNGKKGENCFEKKKRFSCFELVFPKNFSFLVVGRLKRNRFSLRRRKMKKPFLSLCIDLICFFALGPKRGFSFREGLFFLMWWTFFLSGSTSSSQSLDTFSFLSLFIFGPSNVNVSRVTRQLASLYSKGRSAWG